jgi:hypothetical protein
MRLTRKSAVPAVAALAVVALAVSVAQLGGRSAPRPPDLRLSSDLAHGAATAEGGGPSGYELVGTLPAGTPPDARTWSLPTGPAAAEQVQALAASLEAGTPVREGSGWRAGGLFVSGEAGRSWWFAPCAADMPVSSDTRIGCAVAAPGTVSPEPPSDDSSPNPTPAREPEPIAEDLVRRAASPVFAAVGRSLTEARIETHGYGGAATVPGVVDGLTVFGWDTNVQVDATGEIIGAGGWHATPAAGDRYPLVSAQVAFDALPPMPRALALCPVGPDGKGCIDPGPVRITGARLGLSLQGLRDGGQLLVPSWLFEVQDSSTVVPAVAVQPDYLDTGSGPEPSGGSGGSTEPGPGVPPPGTEPGTGSDGKPGTSREPLAFNAVHADTAGLVVVYGDSSSCVHANVTSQVEESTDTVVVALEADRQDPLIACTEDYRPVEVTIRLKAPLGDRTVIDAATGKAVTVTAR